MASAHQFVEYASAQGAGYFYFYFIFRRHAVAERGLSEARIA